MLYEVYCTDCTEIREVILSLKDRNRKIPCPTCKKPMKRRVGKVHLSSKRVTYGY